MQETGTNKQRLKGVVVLCGCAMMALCLLLSFVPWPTQICMTMSGAELNNEGVIIDEGELFVEAWMYNFLLKNDEFYVTDIQLPGVVVNYVSKSLDSELFCLEHWNIYYTSFVAAFEGEEAQLGMVYFNANRSSWVITFNGRYFVGSCAGNYDVALALFQSVLHVRD